MGHLDFGTSPEEQHAVVRRVLRQIYDDLYDNGTPGLITRVEAHMSEAIGATHQQRLQHESNSRKLNWILVIATVVMMITGILAIFVTIELAKVQKLDVPRGMSYESRNTAPRSVLSDYYHAILLSANALW